MRHTSLCIQLALIVRITLYAKLCRINNSKIKMQSAKFWCSLRSRLFKIIIAKRFLNFDFWFLHFEFEWVSHKMWDERLRCRIRKSPDQSLLGSSPELIATRYVLLRSFESRHPPYALHEYRSIAIVTFASRCARRFASRNMKHATHNKLVPCYVLCVIWSECRTEWDTNDTDQQLAITNWC